MAVDGKLDPASRESVLAATLAKHPDAFIAAINRAGLFVPLPPELAATGLRPIEGPASALGLVISEDHRTAVDAWHRVVHEGVANSLVRPIAAPDRHVRLHLIDVTYRLGVYVCVLSGMEDHVAGLSLPSDQVRPRLVTMHKDQTAVITQAGPEVAMLLGWAPAELVGRRSLDLVHPDDHERAIASWMDMLNTPPGAARRVRLRHLHRDGHPVWFEITNHNHLADPDRPGVIAEMLDISDEMAAQEAVRAAEQLMRRLTETLPLAILQIDAERRITYMNERAARRMGADIGDALGGAKFDTIVPADRPAVDNAIAAVLDADGDTDIEYGAREPGHGVRRIRANLRTLTDDTGTVTGAIVCLADVTEEVRLREELRHRATFDPLTGCLNRDATMTALTDALAEPGRHAGTAVIFIDLNGFKQVNDRYGHAAGDRLLAEVASRLRLTISAAGVVGRLGGDEFVVICSNVPDADRARQIGTDLLTGLRTSGITFAGQRLRPEASAGVAWAPRGGTGPEELIARADAAMYQAKKIRNGSHALEMAQ